MTDPDVFTIVDEAHATGCLGAGGVGLVSKELRAANYVQATVHTGGKALGVAGAYICCSRLLKELLINRCRHLIFTTALPPALGSWWLDALQRVRQDQVARDRLQENTHTFRQALRRHGIEPAGEHYIVPIVIGDDAAAVHAADALQRRASTSAPSGPQRFRRGQPGCAWPSTPTMRKLP